MTTFDCPLATSAKSVCISYVEQDSEEEFRWSQSCLYHRRNFYFSRNFFNLSFFSNWIRSTATGGVVFPGKNKLCLLLLLNCMCYFCQFFHDLPFLLTLVFVHISPQSHFVGKLRHVRKNTLLQGQLPLSFQQIRELSWTRWLAATSGRGAAWTSTCASVSQSLPPACLCLTWWFSVI